MDPLFSVVVPIYNIEIYLKECLESIINQTFKNIEIILVDDGSTDSCPTICDLFSERDNRIHVIHKKNGGLVSARQAGAAIASGQYIACVDGDDWVADDYLFDFANTIKEFDSDIVCCGFTSVSLDKYEERNSSLKCGYYSKIDIMKEIFPHLIEDAKGQGIEPNLWAKVVKRELYIKYQMQVDTSIKIGEDGACIKPIFFYANSLSVIESKGYYYRYNPTSLTKNKKSFNWDVPKLIGKNFEKNIDLSILDLECQNYRNIVHRLFNVCVSQFNRDASYKEIAKDIKLHLVDKFYDNAIQKCQFKGSLKCKFAHLTLKHRFIFLIYIYSKVRYK